MLYIALDRQKQLWVLNYFLEQSSSSSSSGILLFTTAGQWLPSLGRRQSTTSRGHCCKTSLKQPSMTGGRRQLTSKNSGHSCKPSSEHIEQYHSIKQLLQTMTIRHVFDVCDLLPPTVSSSIVIVSSYWHISHPAVASSTGWLKTIIIIIIIVTYFTSSSR